jgi:uncharacterized peroxidase-related enzyme
MTFIETVAEGAASGTTAEMYESDRDAFGFLPNFTRAFSLRPEVYGAWRQLNGAIKASMDLRRYELATLAAARRLRSSYCALAHGRVLVDNYLDADTVKNLMVDHEGAGLDPVDVAVMDLADKVASDATSVGEDDLERLRRLGCTDAEILDVVLAAAARCFFSKALDALGAAPDARYSEQLDSSLRNALTVGRAIEGEAGR